MRHCGKGLYATKKTQSEEELAREAFSLPSLMIQCLVPKPLHFLCDPPQSTPRAAPSFLLPPASATFCAFPAGVKGSFSIWQGWGWKS